LKGGAILTPLKFRTVTELKQQATAIVAEVERTKQQIIITKNGRPAVVISPAREEDFSYQEEQKKKPK
jgi:prevent-host-death family protein